MLPFNDTGKMGYGEAVQGVIRKWENFRDFGTEDWDFLGIFQFFIGDLRNEKVETLVNTT